MRKTTMLGKGGGGRTLLAALAVLAVLAAAAAGAAALFDDASHEDADGGAPFYSILGDGGTSGGGPVAKIGDAEYNTLLEAVNAANNNDIIILLESIEIVTPDEKECTFIIDGKAVVLDLNGNALRSTRGESTAQNMDLFAIKSGGTLTVKDSSAAASGEIDAAYYAVHICNGSFVLESGTVRSKNMTVRTDRCTAQAEYIHIAVNGGKLFSEEKNAIQMVEPGTIDVTGGEIAARGMSSGAIYLCSSAGPAVLNMTGGKATVDNRNNSVIYAAKNAKVSISGDAEISSSNCKVLIWADRGAEVDIAGGRLTVEGKDGQTAVKVEQATVAISGGELTNNGSAWNSSVVYISGSGHSVAISGGAFANVGDSGRAIYRSNKNGSIAVTGGTFSSDPSEHIAADTTRVVECEGLWMAMPVTSRLVAFDTAGGSPHVKAQIVGDGGCAAEPSAPAKEGYTFIEWQLDGAAYDFNAPVKSDTTLVAFWMPNVASTGGKGYISLEDAIADAEDGGSVTLLADIEIVTPEADQRSFIIDGKAVVLNLNGKTLKSTRGESTAMNMDLFVIENRGSLTVKDSSEGASGAIDATYYAVHIYEGSFTLESGTIRSEQMTIRTDLFESVNITIEGGKLFSKEKNAINMTAPGVVNVTGGEIVAAKDDAIFVNSRFGDAVLNMSGGTVTSAGHVSADAIHAGNKVTVNIGGDAVIRGDFWGLIYVTDGARVNIAGGTLTAEGDDIIQVGEGTLAISGGELTIGKRYAIYVSKPDQSVAISGGTFAIGDKSVIQSDSDQDVSVTGGTFSSDPSAYVDKTRYSIVPSDSTFRVDEGPTMLTVAFDSKGGAEVPEQKVVYGDPAIEAVTAREGYSFTGWTLGGTAYKFNTPVLQDMELAASWSINQYMATFTDAGESTVDKSQDYGTPLTAPAWTKDGYVLSWNPAVPGTMPAQDLVVTAVWTPKEYKVVFHSAGDYYSQTFTFDAPAELRSAGTRAGYAFDGWAASESGPVKYTDGQRICVRPYAERIDLYAVWTPAVYSISVAAAEDGTVDVSPSAACGSTVTVTLSPAEGYRLASIAAEPAVAFSGDGDVRTFAMPASDVVITAVFAKSLCAVTWKDWDGEILETDGAVPYGEVPTFDGAVPVREPTAEFSYAFSGWSPEISAAAGDATYTAVYVEAVRTYTVAWTDWDGAVLETDGDVPYGETPVYNGAEPVRESTAEFDYAFSGWSPEVAAVSGDVTYTAVYAETLRTYTVTWKDGDITLAIEKDVPYGTAVAWKGASAPVRESTAVFEYTFTGWEPAIAEGMTVIGDMEFLAQFEPVKRSYEIAFVVDGIETVQNAEYGATPAFDGVPAKDADAQYTYTFEKWDPEIAAVSGPATYTAVFTETLRTYAVTWKDWDGTVLETDDAVPYGEVPTFDGAAPAREPTAEFSYVFDKWTPEVFAVAGDVEYTAAYAETVRTYTVTWKDSDIILATEEDVPYGAAVAWKGESAPAREPTAEFEYAFAGWNPAVDESTTVIGDMEFLAQFDSVKRSYEIAFVVNGIETVQTLEYGATPAYDGTPVKDADVQYTYAFEKWEPEIATVSGPATYTAVFSETLRTYAVIWKDWDGTVLETDDAVLYGTVPTFDGAIPVREPTAEFSYVFDKWTPDVVAVAGDAEYAAVYIEIPASAPEMTSIEISAPPEKIAYEIGERFDPAGLAVAGVYADGQKRMLSPSEYTVDAPVLCRPGDFAVAVRYADLSAEFAVSVIAPEPAHETTENDDGSTTTVSTEVGESEGGTVVVRTEATEHPDGTRTEVKSETAYAPDGSVTETSATSSVSADGATSSERTETVKTDASGTEVGRETSVKSSETLRDASGAAVATVTVESVTRTAGGASESAERVAFEAADGGMGTVVESSDGKAKAVTTISVDGMVGADIVSGAVAQADDALDRLLSPPESVEKTVAVETGAGTSAAFAPEAVKAVAGSGAGLEVSGDGGSVGMGVAICEALSSKAEAKIEIVLTHNDDAAVNEVQKDAIDGRHFIDLSALVDGVKVHDLGGTAVVEFPYELKEGELAENMAVFYIDDSGAKELVDSVYRDGRFTMETDHFSVFVVENTAVSDPEDEGGDGAILYVGIAAAAVLILVLAVFLLRRRA